MVTLDCSLPVFTSLVVLLVFTSTSVLHGGDKRDDNNNKRSLGDGAGETHILEILEQLMARSEYEEAVEMIRKLPMTKKIKKTRDVIERNLTETLKTRHRCQATPSPSPSKTETSNHPFRRTANHLGPRPRFLDAKTPRRTSRLRFYARENWRRGRESNRGHKDFQPSNLPRRSLSLS